MVAGADLLQRQTQSGAPSGSVVSKKVGAAKRLLGSHWVPEFSGAGAQRPGNGKGFCDGCAGVGTEVGINPPAEREGQHSFGKGFVLTQAESILWDGVIAVAATEGHGEVAAKLKRLNNPLVIASGCKPRR